MKIILIAPPLMDYVNGALAPIAMDALKTCPPYGLFLLASILRKEGHNTKVIDLIAEGTVDLSLHKEQLVNCQLVGLTTTTLSWPTVKVCIRIIRSYNKNVPIVLGGIHATMFDKYCLHTTDANYCIRGEGELALPLLCETIENGADLLKVPNLTIKAPDGSIQRTAVAPKLSAQQIASFPLPDYNQVSTEIYSGIGLESSRGCPFDCSFCSTSYRKSWRDIEPEVFVDHVEKILPFVAKTRSGILQILDDEFSVKPSRVIAICNEFKKRQIKPKLIYSCRANDLLNEEFVEAIAPYTERFLVGAECGYDEGLKRVGKKTTCNKLTKAASILKKYNLAGKVDMSFILGFPWETKNEVMKTIRFACNLYATFRIKILLQWYCQIPGSRMWEEQRKKEIVHEAQYDDFGFFTNLYLFRTGVSLTTSEINEISDRVQSIVAISKAQNPEREMIEYAHPGSMLNNYPRLPVEITKNAGINSLREISSGFEFYEEKNTVESL